MRAGGLNILKPLILKRSIIINGRKTSVSLEEDFWDGLREIADREKLTRSALVERIAEHHDGVNLSSSIRVFIINHFQTRRTKELAPLPK